MRTIVSVISHNHHKIMMRLGTLAKLTKLKDVIVLCRDNKPSKALQSYCDEHGILYLPNRRQMGFAANNNANVKFYHEHLDPEEGDRLLVLNPDIVLSEETLRIMEKRLDSRAEEIIAPNLYIDKDCEKQDDNVRYYPEFHDFVAKYFLNENKTLIDRSREIPDDQEVWATGACMMMRMETYLQLEGFDERYYMYCEDIDFCARAILNGFRISYLPKAIAIHFRQCASKQFMSKFFRWHVMSVMRYTLSAPQKRPRLSCLLRLAT